MKRFLITLILMFALVKGYLLEGAWKHVPLAVANEQLCGGASKSFLLPAETDGVRVIYKCLKNSRQRMDKETLIPMVSLDSHCSQEKGVMIYSDGKLDCSLDAFPKGRWAFY